ncbi:MAG: T9SS type A sorting domain-containing protein [Aureispira sp.]
MKRISWILIGLLASVFTLKAQPLILSFGDPLIGEKGLVTEVMPDESLWIFGVTSVGLFGSNDILFTRRTVAGTVLNSTRYIGTADLDYPNNMLAQNGELIVVGEVLGAAGGDALVLVLDTTGRLLSRGQYGLAGQSEQFYDIKATADGGFIVTGFGNQPNGNANDILVSKFDQNHQQEWMRTYDFGRNEVGVAVVERPNGGYFVAADQLQSTGNYNVLVLALDTLGNALWDSVVTSPYNGGCKQMKLHQDQIIIVGEMATSTSSAFDPYMIRLNLAGQVQWKGTIPQSNHGDAIFDLVIKDANTYLLTGYSYHVATANTDMVLMVVDSVGQVLDTRYYGGSSFDMGYDIQWQGGNEVILTGFSTIQNDNQLFVIKDDLSNVLAFPREEKNALSSLRLTPNPTTGWLEIMNLNPKGNYEGFIYNNIGQMVWQGILSTNHQLDVTTLPQGYYYLQLQDNTTTWASPFYKW